MNRDTAREDTVPLYSVFLFLQLAIPFPVLDTPGK